MNNNETWLNDLQKQVDDAHHTTDRAELPPPGLWSSIRAQMQPKTEPKEIQPMMSTATMPQAISSPVSSQPVSREGGFRHYANLVATVALVLAVAVGGWLAMSQMPGGDESDRFAVMASPEIASSSCDVEPMTVDEVMGIVNNPYHYMDEDEFPVPRGADSNQTPWHDDFQDVQPRMPVSLNDGLDNEPTQTAFDQASVVISQYVACMQADGTVAMMLRFSDPYSIQRHVFAEFPIYRTEDQVRNYVTDWLSSGEVYHQFTYNRLGETLTFRPAREKSFAGSQIYEFGLGFDQVIYVGSEIYDENGNLVGNFHPGLYRTYNVDPEFLESGVVFTLLHSRYTGQWYIVTDDWMNLDSII